MHLTSKQRDLLRVIAKGNTDGTSVDMDQILELLPYRTSKQSLHFSIRALVAHKLIEKVGLEKRRGRTRSVIQATQEGKYMILGPGVFASAVVVDVDDEVETLGETIESLLG